MAFFMRASGRTRLLGALLTFAAPSLTAQSTFPNQEPSAPRVPLRPATTPPSGNTTGYWQQQADYSIVAQLDESRGLVSARGTLRYRNASPDTLRELWMHQHLNAFRPGSRWSADDAAKGRERFQQLTDPDFGFERFTAPPRAEGRALQFSYPLSPDSTVVRITLARPLPPGGSLRLSLAWEARPSTVPRRQGRRGRHFDFAQWFPKVAVYDRQGWNPNALVNQGELHGEFGTFDVTFVLPGDQVIASTGVPVQGDPGWDRVRLPGSAAPMFARTAYAPAARRASPAVRVPRGFRAVRFVARDVHHFGWSVSPDYRYEGDRWVRPRAGRPAWDTVALHVLHEQWTPGRTLADLRHALTWLESLYGPYAWPQLTIAQRLEESGTEFPMLVMNGEDDRSLVGHEVGHQFTYGMLANNEWQSAWMDEGFTTYQEMWSRGEARVPLAAERAARQWHDVVSIPDSSVRRRVRAVDAFTATVEATARVADPPPMGLRADLFASKAEYDAVVYDRAAGFYSALHDVLGDELFRRFLRLYAGRWTFRHVDRWAMQKTAEQVSGILLGWLFDQWVTSAGTIDYALQEPVVARVGGDSATSRIDRWSVTVQLQRRGVYRHPMPVGVRTASGWTVVRADPRPDRQAVRLVLSERPLDVWLDPFGSVESSTSVLSRFVLP
jgi:hypothetical protein